ncbi:MAG: hypothetical protein LUO93_02400 [Methanomicrobiales archaeon]|nr:hypothetical protein [Methanomicrobiales archaeon]
MILRALVHLSRDPISQLTQPSDPSSACRSSFEVLAALALALLEAGALAVYSLGTHQ